MLAADLDFTPINESVDAPPLETFVAEGEHETREDLAAFAQALTDAGVIFWGSDLCPVCVRQKNIFGPDAEPNLDFIEVWESFGVFNEVGNANGITATPTWEFADGTRIPRLMSLSELSEQSGVPLPDSILVLNTNAGPIEVQLFPDVAPITVQNFTEYINDGSFDNNFFHRYPTNGFNDFVLQAGSFNTSSLTVNNEGQFSSVPDKAPIINEFDPNEVSNTRGTIAMAQRGTNPNSATSGFFVNLSDNDGSGPFSNLDTLNGGFAVFGEVLDLDGLTAIQNAFVPVDLEAAPFDLNLPLLDVDEVPLNGAGEMLVIESFSGSGTIAGTVFDDTNRDGDQDAGELGLENVLVFIDANDDGFFDADELSDLTDADGNYSIVAPNGDHVVRRLASANTVFVEPATGRTDVVGLGIRETRETNFASFIVPEPTGLDLLNISDTGLADDDDRTMLDNSAGNPLRFEVSGVVNGATVRIFANGDLVGEANGSGQVIVTTNQTDPQQGLVEFAAEQVVTGIAGPRITLDVLIDSSIADSTLPAQTPEVLAGETLTVDINNAEEADSNFRYALQSPGVDPLPTGLTINENTGVITWTPTANQTGEHDVEIVSTDGVGNTVTQPLTILVERNEQMTVRLEVTDLAGNPIENVDVGDRFLVQAFVRDNRVVPQGVAEAYIDLTYENLFASAETVEFNPDFDTDRREDLSQLGLVNEIGAGGNSTIANGDEVLLFSIQFRANIEGLETFEPSNADDLPLNDSMLIGEQTAVEQSRILFEGDTVMINESPGANGESFGFDEDAMDVNLPVLNNDLPFLSPSGDLFISEVNQGSAGGSLRIAADNMSLVYSAPANFSGIETFTYTVTDGVATDEGFVVIEVTATNDPPNAVDDEETVDEDGGPVTILVLENDDSLPDMTNETLEVVNLGATSDGGVVSITNGGTTVLYEPALNFNGTETFTYDVSDGELTATATVTVTVNPTNDRPMATNNTFNVLEDADPVDLDPLSDDIRAPDDNETLRIVSVGTPSLGGTVEIINNGTEIRYTPAANVGGETETFTYTISDRETNGLMDEARIDIVIEEVNDPPIANPDEVTVTKGSVDTVINLVGNDSVGNDEGKGDVLTIDSVSAGSQQGTLVINNDLTSVTYTPDPDASGEETFTYTLSDGRGGTAEATLTITIREFTPGSISGTTYFDLNSNGQQDENESALVGVTINLSGVDQFDEQITLSQVTDVNGQYLFSDLAPGSYTITQEQPQLVVDNAEHVTNANSTVVANDTIDVELGEGDANEGNDFTELTRSMIAGVFRLSDLYKRSSPRASVTVLTEKATGNSVFTVSGFGVVEMAEVELKEDPAQLDVSIVNGAEMHATIPIPSTYVRQIETPEVTVTRIWGTIQQLGFTTTNGQNGAQGEGEGEENNAIAEGESNRSNAAPEPIVVSPATSAIESAPASVTSQDVAPPPVLELGPLLASSDTTTSHSQDGRTEQTEVASQQDAVDVFFSNEEATDESVLATDLGPGEEDAFVEAVDVILDDVDALLGV